MSADNIKQVLIRVDKDVKHRWEQEVVDNPEVPHNSMAAAIRSAMERTYFRDTDDTDKTANVDVDLGPIDDKLDTVVNRIEEIDERVQRVESATITDRDPMKLANSIHLHLKRYPSADKMPSLVKAARETDDNERTFALGTPEAIAEFYDTDEATVQDALDLLEDDRRNVESVEDSGRTRYYVKITRGPDAAE